MGLEQHWYSHNARAYAFWPLSLVFQAVVKLRHAAYQAGLCRRYKLPVPVIVVGNISVGGSGKTPLVIELVELLRRAGLQPGIVSRGYRGRSQTWPRHVDASSDPVQVGDEPVLLAQRCQCPITVGPDRSAAAQALLAESASPVNIIVSDDGLQHYAMQRDIEIAVIDSQRGLGNGFCLPAGPLREPERRLQSVDYIIYNGIAQSDGQGYSMVLSAEHARNLVDDRQSKPLADFRGTTVHAVAGIGHPERFFTMLQHAQLNIIRHAFPDHHHFTAKDVCFADAQTVLLTEKDAVKCRPFAQPGFWSVPVTARLDERFEQQLLKHLSHTINST